MNGGRGTAYGGNYISSVDMTKVPDVYSDPKHGYSVKWMMLYHEAPTPSKSRGSKGNYAVGVRIPHDTHATENNDRPFYIKTLVMQEIAPNWKNYGSFSTTAQVSEDGTLTRAGSQIDGKTLYYAGDENTNPFTSSWGINRGAYRNLAWCLNIVVRNPNWNGSTAGLSDVTPTRTYWENAPIPFEYPVFNASDPFWQSNNTDLRTPPENLWHDLELVKYQKIDVDKPESGRQTYYHQWVDPISNQIVRGVDRYTDILERAAPVITLAPGRNLTTSTSIGTDMLLYSEYTSSSELGDDPGVSALDADGNDIEVTSDWDEIVQTIDFSIQGEYVVTYSTQDHTGLKSGKTRKIKLFGPPRFTPVPKEGDLKWSYINENMNRWFAQDETWLKTGRFTTDRLSLKEMREWYGRSTFIPGDTYDRHSGVGSLHWPGAARGFDDSIDSLNTWKSASISKYRNRFNVTLLVRVKPESQPYTNASDGAASVQVIAPAGVTTTVTLNGQSISTSENEALTFAGLGETRNDSGDHSSIRYKHYYPVKIELTDELDGLNTTTMDHIWLQIGRDQESLTNLYSRHTWWPVRNTWIKDKDLSSELDSLSTTARQLGKNLHWIRVGDSAQDESTHNLYLTNNVVNSDDSSYSMHSLPPSGPNARMTWSGFMQNYAIWNPAGFYDSTTKKLKYAPHFEKSTRGTHTYVDHATLSQDTEYYIMLAGWDTHVKLYEPLDGGGYSGTPTFEFRTPLPNIANWSEYDDFNEVEFAGGGKYHGVTKMNYVGNLNELNQITNPADYDNKQRLASSVWRTKQVPRIIGCTSWVNVWDVNRQVVSDDLFELEPDSIGCQAPRRLTMTEHSKGYATQYQNHEPLPYSEPSYLERLKYASYPNDPEDHGWSQLNPGSSGLVPQTPDGNSANDPQPRFFRTSKINPNLDHTTYKVWKIEVTGTAPTDSSDYKSSNIADNLSWLNKEPGGVAAVIYRPDPNNPVAFPHGHRFEQDDEVLSGNPIMRSIYMTRSRGSSKEALRDMQYVVGPNIAWTTRDHCYGTAELQRIQSDRYDIEAVKYSRNNVVPTNTGTEFEWKDDDNNITTISQASLSLPVIDVVHGDIINLQLDDDGEIINSRE